MRVKSKPHVMLILLSMPLIAKKRVMGENVVISDGTLFCRLRREEEETLSKWNKLINHVFCFVLHFVLIMLC